MNDLKTMKILTLAFTNFFHLFFETNYMKKLYLVNFPGKHILKRLDIFNLPLLNYTRTAETQ